MLEVVVDRRPTVVVVDPAPALGAVVVVVLLGGLVVVDAGRLVVVLAGATVVVVVVGAVVVVVGPGRVRVMVPPGGRPLSTWVSARLVAVDGDAEEGFTPSHSAPRPRNSTAMTAVDRRMVIRGETGRRRLVVSSVSRMRPYS